MLTSCRHGTDNRMFCTHEDCQDEHGRPKKFFSRKADVTRHHKSRHEITYIDCPKRNCERKGSSGFTRRDHLTEHLRGFHMENIAKRPIANTKTKRGDTQTTENSNESNSSSEESPGDLPRSRSRGSSFADQAHQHFKQETLSPSDEEAEDAMLMDEDYHFASTKRSKPEQKHISKNRSAQVPPCRRTASNPQPRQYIADVTARDVPQHYLTVSPEFATSRMMPQSPAYATHQAIPGRNSSGHVASPLYASHDSMEPYYHVPSMAQSYQGMHSQQTSRYSTHDDMNDFHFRDMQN